MGPHKNTGEDTDYLAKRARNNDAVKRSREKARQKAKETHDRVDKLKTENESLEERVRLLSKELTFLKDLLMSHAGGGAQGGPSAIDMDIAALLDDDYETSHSKLS